MAGTSPAMTTKVRGLTGQDAEQQPRRQKRNICFRKIESCGTVLFALTSLINSRREDKAEASVRRVFHNGIGHRGPRGRKEKMPGGSAQALEKVRFRHGNPRKSKPFPLIFLAPAWQDFARFD